MTDLITIGANAKAAETVLRTLNTNKKNEVLALAGDVIIQRTSEILAANQIDIQRAKENGMASGMIDRLTLDQERILAIVEGLRQLIDLEDPIGEVLSMKQRPNGLMIGQKRVPLGVVGIIYESRPNVTCDAFGLCFKTGNAVILKGGSDALESNKILVTCIREALEQSQLPADAIQLIEDTNRETTTAFMKLNKYVDVLIPRGGAGLIQSVVANSTIPTIETGTGNCHIYVDQTADLQMAAEIIFNAKTQRIGVCNACESVVIHQQILSEFLPILSEKLAAKQVEIRGDEQAVAVDSSLVLATDEDFKTEYLDYIVSVKTVAGIDEAIAHINQYSTHHSEAIISNDYRNTQKFLNEIDSATVYVNASTRFTDGFEFGFGAEIGISTQKLHARGPMGLLALTTTKYIVYGDGQIR